MGLWETKPARKAHAGYNGLYVVAGAMLGAAAVRAVRQVQASVRELQASVGELRTLAKAHERAELYRFETMRAAQRQMGWRLEGLIEELFPSFGDAKAAARAASQAHARNGTGFAEDDSESETTTTSPPSRFVTAENGDMGVHPRLADDASAAREVPVAT